MFFLRKPYEHSIELHYGHHLQTTYYYQELPLQEEFFKEKLQHCLSLTDSKQFYEELEDGYGIYETEESFEYLNYSTFTMFFDEIAVDIPRCFKKTYSVKRSINELELLRFNNYFMRHGLRYKSFSFFSKTLWSLIMNSREGGFIVGAAATSWRDIYLTFASLTFNGTYNNLKFPIDETTTFNHKQNDIFKNIEFTWVIRRLLFQHFQSFLPMFSFYIYKVDKQIFKNTRGRSGKYTFIWKYITSYKRNSLVMHWLLKELRITPGRTLEDRLKTLIINMSTNPKTTWIYRIKKFSYNYVYRNCRQTLAESYRTVKK